MWSSQGIKSAQIAICRVFPTGLTRMRVTGQRAVRMECLMALLVCLIQAVAVATQTFGVCYQKWTDKQVVKSRHKDDQTRNYVYLTNLRPIIIAHSRGDITLEK